MIVDGILLILQGIVNVLLAPLTVINWVSIKIENIAIIKNFINVIAYILPWKYITPLITFLIGLFVFRAVVALIKTIWELLPIL